MNRQQANRLGRIGPKTIVDHYVCTQKTPVCTRTYLSKTREMTYQNIEIGMYRYVLGTYTGSYYFIDPEYVQVHTFFLEYILKIKQFRLD